MDESDRRIIYLGITDKGADILKRAQLEGQKLRTNLLDKLTEQERKQLANLYSKLNKEDQIFCIRTIVVAVNSTGVC